ncbi:MAG: hypothetical protein IKX20_08710, partial [Paludibacteraceae bacterium]|nr:hypothetical protein [Paludibacteraceae bacterium]
MLLEVVHADDLEAILREDRVQEHVAKECACLAHEATQRIEGDEAVVHRDAQLEPGTVIVELLCQHDVIYLKTEKQGTPIEVAVMYNTDYSENIHSYVNN